MPTYDYRCPAGHEFEKTQKISDSRRRARCPTCGRMAVRRISGGAGLVFKGSGFYITDYKRAGQAVERAEPGEKGEQGEKGEKTGKAEKTEKAEKAEKKSVDSGKKAAE